jgi:ceramide glucosyltransferase
VITKLFLVIALLGTLTSSAYLLLVLWAVWRRKFRRKLENASPFLPALSLLKPVHGIEPRLEENLESFFRQDYPDYELIFCARVAEDPALRLAAKLAAKYPRVKVKIQTCGEPPWTNAKVYSLSKMMEVAEHELLVISDSDVCVEPAYLREVIQPLQDERVGLVTCIYRGVATRSLWSRLEALGMSVEMTSGVLVAEMLEGMKFALGPTMAMRKKCVQQIGGFSVFADYCADDYLLGNLIEAEGYKVVLSDHVIDHIVLNRSALASLKHQVRWMRSTRFSRPKGHAGTIFTFAMPFGVLGLIAGLASGYPISGVLLFATACLNRVVQSLAVGYGVVGDRSALASAWLYPFRDLLGFILWCGSYLSAKITWRNEAYTLGAGGRMLRPQKKGQLPELNSSSAETQTE